MLRGWSHSARTQEWVETTGVPSTAAACSIASRETCATSTSMPSRFISAMAARPSGGQAAMLGLGVAQIGARDGGIGQRVVAVVGEREVARAAPAQGGEAAEVVADGEAILHRRDDGEHAVALGRLDRVGGFGRRAR